HRRSRPCPYTTLFRSPGITPTRLFERASYPEGAWRELCERYVAGAELSADRVASEAIAALAAGRLYAVVGGRAKRYAWLKRLAPAWLIDRVAQKAATESPTSTPSPEQHSPALRLTSP